MMKRLHITLGMVVVLLLLGIRGAQADDPESCRVHADCPIGEICYDGECVDDSIIFECTVTCDCPQTYVCYKGHCLKDPKQDVLCCERPGCIPGMPCLTQESERSYCPEDPMYVCDTACDCGPAHCCKENMCIKDVNDPWRPGGEAIDGLSCEQGIDATYCCDGWGCLSGRTFYGADAFAAFRCYSSPDEPARTECGGARCFGTAANCPTGQVCVDTLERSAPGTACWLTAGGTCLANALAESDFGWSPQDLIPGRGACAEGAPCDVGWMSGMDGEVAYSRVVTEGVCGDGTCDPGEFPPPCSDCDLSAFPNVCPQDCFCGDGKCDPVEVDTCATDCGLCGDGECKPWESPYSCAQDCRPPVANWQQIDDRFGCEGECACPDAAYYPGEYTVCGDGYCQSNDGRGPEGCVNCPQDCGPCSEGASMADADVPRFGGAQGVALPEFSPDLGRALVIADGVLYVAGQTYAADLPRAPLPSSLPPAWNGFIMRAGTDGEPTWARYLPALTASGRTVRAMAVAPSGAVYLAGTDEISRVDGDEVTAVYALPAGAEAYGIDVGATGALYVVGDQDLGLLSIGATGALRFRNTEVGGTLYDVAIGPAGAIYAGGMHGVATFDPAGNLLTLLDLHGVVHALALHGDALYVAGRTIDQDEMPVSPTALDPIRDAAGDAFVARLTSGGALVAVTYLGGAGYDVAFDVAVDRNGQIFVVGQTNAADFPGLAGSDDMGAGRAFLTELTMGEDGSSALIRTRLIPSGGPALPPYRTPDRALAVAVDEPCGVFLTGEAGWFVTGTGGENPFTDALIDTLPKSDTVAPVVQATVAKSSLWPVNHKFVDVGLHFTVDDQCDGEPAVAVSVTSDEPTGPEPDAVWLDEHTLALRAERQGNGDGRVYEITVAATDAAGNVGTASVHVVVNHDVASEAVDSGQCCDAFSVDLGAAEAVPGEPGRIYLPLMVVDGN